MKRILGIFIVAVHGVIAPVLPANADVATPTTYYVATSGTANLTAGDSCANPNFVGSNQTPIQAALYLAASENRGTMEFTDVGFNSYTGSYTTIVLCEGTWTLDKTLVADANVKIQGSGYKKTILDGNDKVRILSIGNYDPTTEPTSGDMRGFAARVQLSKVTLKNGAASGAGESGMGGAVLVRGRDSFKATNVFFQGNSAVQGAAIAGLGDGTDNPGGIDASPSGDLFVDSSAFSGNLATDSGIFYAHRYQRHDNGQPGLGAQLYNSSFFGNEGKRTVLFNWTYGESIGNSMVGNRLHGAEEFYAADWINIHGNVFAQDSGNTVCAGDGQGELEIASDSVATSYCYEPKPSTSGPLQATYSEIDPAGIYWSDIIPVQRFGLSSFVREIWPTTQNCQGSDALLNTRALDTTNCDAGPWQQPLTVATQDPAVVDLNLKATTSGFEVATAPSNETGGLVTYSSSDLLFCKVDVMTGLIKTWGTGNCVITWSISGSAKQADLTGSQSVSFNGDGFYQGSTHGFTALHHGETTYFVSYDGVIDKLDNSGYEKAWVTLPFNDWGGSAWSSAIDSEGHIYVAAWGGKIAKVSPSQDGGDPTVNANFVILADTEIPSIAISPSDELYVAAFDAGTDGLNSRLHKYSTAGSGSATIELPDATRPGYIAFDQQENLTIIDYYDSPQVVHIEKATGDITTPQNGFTGWGQQVSVNSFGDAYFAQYSENVISKYDRNGVYSAKWLELPNSCWPTGLVLGNHENIFISCSGMGSIVEVDVMTQKMTELIRPPFGNLGFSQLFVSPLNILSAPSDQGANVLVDVQRDAQAALLLTSQVQQVGAAAQLVAAGGNGAGTIIYESITPTVCEVDASGLVTKLLDGSCKVSYSKRGDNTFAPAYSSEHEVTFTAAAVPVVPPVTPVVENNTPTQSTPITTPVVPVEAILTPVKGIKDLTTDKFKALTPEKIATIAVEEAKNITQSKIKSLVSAQLKALTVEAISALKPSVLAAISPSRLKLLTAAQKKALTTSQLKALSKVQRKALGR